MSIKLSKSENASENYLCKIIKVEHIRDHSNADRLSVVMIDGNSVITSKGVNVGDLYVYFPPESKINADYLAGTDSFRDKTMNADKEKAGFFEKNCRVRTMMLRGEPSMGYMVPLHTFECLLNSAWMELENHVGEEFDTINDGFRDILMVQKYIVQSNKQKESTEAKLKRKAKADLLIPNQFKLHIDTTPLKKYMEQISPDDIISISDKLHGTSLVAGYVLTKKPLTWAQKALKWLGADILDTEYKHLVSSRNVIKNIPGVNKQSYYESDIWTKAADPILPFLKKGETIYAEIVGYLDTGAPIQGAAGKNWDYGCNACEHAVYIYRITYTNVSGDTVELPLNMVEERAKQLGVRSVPIIYYGKAKDYVPELDTNNHWHENLLAHIEKDLVEIGKCKFSKNTVENEGIVLRRENLIPVPYKLKQLSFIMKESQAMDKGVVDIESGELEEA